MSSKYIMVIIVAALIMVGLTGFFFLPKEIKNPTMCTMEAKLCPDGSYVGRSGPNCQFAECPKVTEKVEDGVLTGKVTLSPTCPVERIPPDPSCAPKGFATLLDITRGTFFVEVHTDAAGKFLMHLPPGTYNITHRSNSIYPNCEKTSAEVKANATTTLNISCDTGIR
jgi:hypothetical protein